MSTYGTMQDRIADEINRTDLTTQIQSAIKSAIQFYKTHRFNFNEGKSVRNTADGDEFVGLPSDYLEVDTLGITVSSRYYQLMQRTHESLDKITWSDGSYKGFPIMYAIYEQNIRLYPIPDGTYELKMTYLRSLSDVSATGDTSSWFTDGEELVRTHAKIDLLENIIRGPDAMNEAGSLRMRENEVLRNMRSASTRRRATNRITPSGF